MKVAGGSSVESVVTVACALRARPDLIRVRVRVMIRVRVRVMIRTRVRVRPPPVARGTRYLPGSSSPG